MASNSKFSATLEYGTDFVYDYSCLSCSEDGRNSEAKHCCQDCEQFFCEVCIELHNRIMKRHTVLGRTDVKKWSTAPALVGPIARCEKHPQETIKLECWDHRQLCCHVCVSIDHK